MFMLAAEDWWLNGWPSPTKLYLYDAASTVADFGTTKSTATPATDLHVGNKSGGLIHGVLQTSILSSTPPGTNAIRRDFIGRFSLFSLGAQTIPSGTWTLAAAIGSNGHDSAGVYCVLYVWRPSTSALVGALYDNVLPTVISSGAVAELAATGSFSGTSLAVLDGDLLVLEVWGATSNNTTSGTSTQTQFFYDGTTVGSATSNAANITAPAVLSPSVGGGGITLRLLSLTGVGV